MLILIPFEENLVCRTARQALAEKDPSGTLVVFPGRRFLTFLRRELATLCPPPCFPPRLLPFDALVGEVFRLHHPGFVAIDEMTRVFRLWECLQQAEFAGVHYGLGGGAGGFARWYPAGLQWLRAVEAVLAEAGDLEKLPQETFARLVELGEHHREYRRFIGALPALALAYRDRLRANREMTSGTAARTILDRAGEGNLLLPNVARWLLVGFSVLSRVEEKLLGAIARSAPYDLLVQTDQGSWGDPRSPFARQRRMALSLGLDPVVEGPGRGGDFWARLAARVVLHPTPSTETEMAAAAEVIARRSPDLAAGNWLSMGVAMPDPGSLVPFVQNVVSRFEAGRITANITLGYPFSRTPLCQLLLAILELAGAELDGRLPVAPYLTILRHPFVKGNGEAGGGYFSVCHAIEETIAAGGLLEFTTGEIELALAEALGEKNGQPPASGFASKADALAQATDFHHHFVFTGGAGWDLLPFLRQTLRRIAGIAAPGGYLFLAPMVDTAVEVLDELQGFVAANSDSIGPAERDDVIGWLRSVFTGREIGFDGTPLQGLQVMGMLEFRGLSFDEVVILDTIEGVLPGARAIDPLLPREIRLALGMPPNDDRVAIYAAHFFALLGRARKVHLFYPTAGTASGGKGEPSRFIRRLQVEAAWAEATIAEETRLFQVALRHRPRQGAAKTPAVMDRLRRMSWYVSAIETYVSCPLRFYYGSVLGLNERSQPGEADQRFWGSLVHATLHRLYLPWQGRELDEKAFTDIGDRLAAELDRQFAESGLPVNRGAVRIRRWVTERRLARFLALDRGRALAEGGGLVLTDLERSLSRRLVASEGDGEIDCRGRVDRLNRCRGRLEVIDYKTGAAGVKTVRAGDAPLSGLFRQDEAEYRQSLATFARRFRGIQVMTYLWMIDQPGDGGADGFYAHVGESRDPFRPVWPAEATAELREALAGEFAAGLRELASDLFLRPEFLPVPGRNCATCPFTLSCGDL